jgi:hypothetical protein
MVSTRADVMRRQLGVPARVDFDIGDERVFFRGYSVREQDIPIWHVVSRRRVLLPDGVWLDRASWMQSGDPWQRVLLVETYECRSREDAQDLLAELLAQFQLPPNLVTSRDGRGGIALTDPRGSESVFSVGNVVVRVGSGSVVPAPAAAVADYLRTMMATRPAEPMTVAAEAPVGARPRAARLRRRTVVGAPTPVEEVTARRRPVTPVTAGAASNVEPEGYVKAFSRNGDLRVGDDERVEFIPDASGEGVVEVFDVGARGAEASRLVIDVDAPS